MTDIIKVDRDLIYNNIGINLNKEEIITQSGIFKLIEPVINELETFAQLANTNMRELSINTATLPVLQRVGAELNVFRENFTTLDFTKDSQVVSFTVTDSELLQTLPEEGLVIFNKNYTQNFSDFSVTFLETVTVKNLDTPIFVSVRLGLLASKSFFINRDSAFQLATVSNKDVLPSIELKFSKNVGLSNIQESVEDFRTKLLNIKEMPFKNVNSILKQGLQELPLNVTAEIVNSVGGVNSHTIYLSTARLEREGYDQTLEEFLIPAYIQAINKRLDYTTDFVVESATPFILSIQFKKPAKLNISASEIKLRLNEFLQSLGSLTYAQVAQFISTVTENFIAPTDLTIELKSRQIFESNFVVDENETIILPVGRFFYAVEVSQV